MVSLWLLVMKLTDPKRLCRPKGRLASIWASLTCVFFRREKNCEFPAATESREALAKAQRQQARKQKGSVNHKRANKKIARLHADVTRIRSNTHHQLSRSLINRFSSIAVEDLAVAGLARTRMAKSIYDVGWSELIRQIEYKADWAQRGFARYPRFARSTGVCPSCGVIGDKLPLSVREWTCECGDVHDRDIAAAQIIKTAAPLPNGVTKLLMVGTVCPEPDREVCPKRASVGNGKERGLPPLRPPEPATNVPSVHLRVRKG